MFLVKDKRHMSINLGNYCCDLGASFGRCQPRINDIMILYMNEIVTK